MRAYEFLTEEQLDEINWKKTAAAGALSAAALIGSGDNAHAGHHGGRHSSYYAPRYYAVPPSGWYQVSPGYFVPPPDYPSTYTPPTTYPAPSPLPPHQAHPRPTEPTNTGSDNSPRQERFGERFPSSYLQQVVADDGKHPDDYWISLDDAKLELMIRKDHPEREPKNPWKIPAKHLVKSNQGTSKTISLPPP